MIGFVEGWFTDMHKASAEIAGLRAELAETRRDAAETIALLGGERDCLRAELTYAKTYRKLADDMSAANLKLNAAARQDAEGIARLTATLKYYASFESPYGETARAALACRPQGEKS